MPGSDGATRRARPTSPTWSITRRFLILPWVEVPHLASHILSLAARQFPSDWLAAYGVRPLLLETLVDRPYSGTCYRAANWICVGQTQGRGRMDRTHKAKAARKDILLYPLEARWRERLCQLPFPPLPCSLLEKFHELLRPWRSAFRATTHLGTCAASGLWSTHLPAHPSDRPTPSVRRDGSFWTGAPTIACSRAVLGTPTTYSIRSSIIWRPCCLPAGAGDGCPGRYAL